MKKLIQVSKLLTLLIIISSCNSNAQQQSAAQMLKDSVKQKEIFGAICNDSVQMKQFMAYMMQHKKSMMGGNQQMMMNNMMSDTSMCKMMMGNMMDKMAKDSSMCKMMCKQMMNNDHMKGMMQNMGKQKGNMMDGGMMCPMHDKMKMGEMKKEELKPKQK